MTKTSTIKGITYFKYTCSFCGHELLAKKGEKGSLTQCPFCKSSSPWLIKPKTERVLFELQKIYLSKLDLDAFENYAKEIKKPKSEQDQAIIQKHLNNMDQKTLGKMYELVQDYTGSLLKKYIKLKAFFLSYDEFIDKTYEITYRWYSQFTKKPGFRIKDSWAGQLRWKIIEVLYDDTYRHECETLSLDFVDKSFDNNQSFLDKEGINLNNMFIQANDPYSASINLSIELRKVLKLIILSLQKVSKQDTILSLLAFLFFIKNSKRKEHLLYSFYGNNIKENNEKIKLVFRRYLRDINA